MLAYLGAVGYSTFMSETKTKTEATNRETAMQRVEVRNDWDETITISVGEVVRAMGTDADADGVGDGDFSGVVERIEYTGVDSGRAYDVVNVLVVPEVGEAFWTDASRVRAALGN